MRVKSAILAVGFVAGSASLALAGSTTLPPGVQFQAAGKNVRLGVGCGFRGKMVRRLSLIAFDFYSKRRRPLPTSLRRFAIFVLPLE